MLELVKDSLLNLSHRRVIRQHESRMHIPTEIARMPVSSSRLARTAVNAVCRCRMASLASWRSTPFAVIRWRPWRLGGPRHSSFRSAVPEKVAAVDGSNRSFEVRAGTGLLLAVRVEMDEQCVSAGHVDLDGWRVVVDQGGDDGAGGRAGTAGQCFVFDSALVGSQPDRVSAQQLDEVRIRAFGFEYLMVPDGGTHSANVDFRGVFDEENRVGDAGVQAVEFQVFPEHRDVLANDQFVRRRKLDLGRTTIAGDFGVQCSGERFDDLPDPGGTDLAGEDGAAAGTIAAHFGFGAVRVEEAHPVLVTGGPCRLNQDHAVSSCGDASRAGRSSQFRQSGLLHESLPVVDHQEIIAGSRHLDDGYGDHAAPFSAVHNCCSL